MGDKCTDNRFELIEKYKKKLIEATNIETAPDEMKVLDNILFRFWQMGWLDRLEQPEQRWIPCSERLPEETKDVLVCYDFKGNRSVLIGALYSDEKFYGYDDEYLTPEGRKYRKAVAWMPLPEPYKGEQE